MTFNAIKIMILGHWMWISIALLSAIVIWDWITIRLGLWRTQGGSPICGKCGYSVTGLERMVCPECGSDLRQVGIVNRQIHRPRMVHRVLVALIFTASIFAAARVTMPVLYQLWPVKYSYTSRPEVFRPASRAYQFLEIDASVDSYSRHSTVLPVRINMSVTLNSHPSSWGYRLQHFSTSTADSTCQCTDKTGELITLNETFSEQAILKWFAACDIPATDPKVILEARRIRNLCLSPARMNPAVHGYWSGRSSDEVFGTTDWSQASDRQGIPLGKAFIYTMWAALWMTGMAHIIRRAKIDPTHRELAS